MIFTLEVVGWEVKNHFYIYRFSAQTITDTSMPYCHNVMKKWEREEVKLQQKMSKIENKTFTIFTCSILSIWEYWKRIFELYSNLAELLSDKHNQRKSLTDLIYCVWETVDPSIDISLSLVITWGLQTN